jgi:hypothetical protein
LTALAPCVDERQAAEGDDADGDGDDFEEGDEAVADAVGSELAMGFRPVCTGSQNGRHTLDLERPSTRRRVRGRALEATS